MGWQYSNCRLSASTTHTGEETPHRAKESAIWMDLPISSPTVEGLGTDLGSLTPLGIAAILAQGRFRRARCWMIFRTLGKSFARKIWKR